MSLSKAPLQALLADAGKLLSQEGLVSHLGSGLSPSLLVSLLGLLMPVGNAPNNHKSSSKASLSHALTLTPLLALCPWGWTQAGLQTHKIPLPTQPGSASPVSPTQAAWPLFPLAFTGLVPTLPALL